MSKIKDKILEIQELLMECELEHIEPTKCTFDGIDVNALSYWLCFVDTTNRLDELLENLVLYGGIKQ